MAPGARLRAFRRLRSFHFHCQAQDLLQIALDAEPAPSVAPISVRGKLLPLRLQLNPVLLRQVLAFVAVPPSLWAAAQALEVRAQGLGHSLAAAMKETRRGLQGRAILLAEIEGAMTEAELENASLFPRWLHGIRRVNDEAVEETEWSGRLRALKNAVTKVATELVSVEPNVSKKVHAVRDELTQKIDGIESKIVATEAKLDKIMELLGAAAAGPSAPQAAATDSADEGAADDPSKTPRGGKKGVIRKMSSK